MEIGDRVYHPGLNKNGIVRAIREGFQCRIGIELFTTDEIEETPHDLDETLNENKGLWVNESKLVPTPKPDTMINKVTVFGNRGLQKRIRLIAELPRRFNRDGSNVIVNYGVVKHKLAPRIMVLNRNIRRGSKLTHLKLFERQGVQVPAYSKEYIEGYIQKPLFSFGGRGIVEGNDINFDNAETYFQQKIRKVREFRVHVLTWADSQVPIIQEKTPGNPEDLCWNRHNNGKFETKFSKLLGINKLEDVDLQEKLSEIGRRCARALRYDFGGVDVLMNEGGELFVVEMNCRCGLRERSLGEYKQWFWKLGNMDLREYQERRVR